MLMFFVILQVRSSSRRLFWNFGGDQTQGQYNNVSQSISIASAFSESILIDELAIINFQMSAKEITNVYLKGFDHNISIYHLKNKYSNKVILNIRLFNKKRIRFGGRENVFDKYRQQTKRSISTTRCIYTKIPRQLVLQLERREAILRFANSIRLVYNRRRDALQFRLFYSCLDQVHLQFPPISDRE